VIDLIAYFRGRQPSDVHVARIKLGGDGGQGSLKISLDVLFVDDPLLLPPHEVKRTVYIVAERHLDSGVKRTFILALLVGVCEGHIIVQWIMRHLQPERLFNTYDHAVITFPTDMKFQQYLVGLQQHSSRHGYLYSLWSMFTAYSRPDERGSAESLQEDAEAFKTAVEHNPMTSTIDFNNSICIHTPTAYIMRNPLPLLLSVPPAILHLLLGITKKQLEQLQLLCQLAAQQLIHSANVGHSQHRGSNGYALVGTDCLKVLHKAQHLLSLPSLKRRRRVLRNDNTPSDDTYVSDKYYKVIRLLRDAMITFRTAYLGVSRSLLPADWAVAIE